jgi:ABC-type multidrug transport system fused ATPase/permease subunit
MFICTYIYMCTWVYTAEVTAKRIRERYLKAILRQDVAFFDKVGPGEVTTRIQTDTRMWFFQFQSYNGVPTADTPRFGPSGHIRKGRSRRQLPRCIFHRFHLGIFEKLAAGSGYVVFHATCHFHRGRLHE